MDKKTLLYISTCTLKSTNFFQLPAKVENDQRHKEQKESCLYPQVHVSITKGRVSTISPDVGSILSLCIMHSCSARLECRLYANADV